MKLWKVLKWISFFFFFFSPDTWSKWVGCGKMRSTWCTKTWGACYPRGKWKKSNPGAKTASVKPLPSIQAFRSSRITEFLSSCFFHSILWTSRQDAPGFPTARCLPRVGAGGKSAVMWKQVSIISGQNTPQGKGDDNSIQQWGSRWGVAAFQVYLH